MHFPAPWIVRQPHVHVIIITGGARVLSDLGAALQLDASRMAPSRDTLWEYGNVSSRCGAEAGWMGQGGRGGADEAAAERVLEARGQVVLCVRVGYVWVGRSRMQ
jgi:hypothetical protein